MASLGCDRVTISAPADDIGAENSGIVYLFATNGTILTTFTNPVPKSGASFGRALAVAGDHQILLGSDIADHGGAAYLFDTNGSLRTTFTNPSPASVLRFGSSLAAVGTDRVLIGARGYHSDIPNSGAAFLFRTNGTLLATFADPRPGDHFFGVAVASVFNDKCLVGAPGGDPITDYAGRAYLFNTNGILLTTFISPRAGQFDSFGFALAPLGSDRVVISHLFDNTPQSTGGAAYLFNSNGTLLTTFSSPVPEPSAQFGFSISIVPGDRILIGAPYDDAWTRIGAAYLFSTNGHLLAAFAHPFTLPYSNQYLAFGAATAALDSETVLIAAPQDGTGAMNTGAAYLLRIPAPPLRIRLLSPSDLVISWPSPASGLTLQQSAHPAATANWSNITQGIRDDGTNATVVLNRGGARQLYRLSKP